MIRSSHWGRRNKLGMGWDWRILIACYPDGLISLSTRQNCWMQCYPCAEISHFEWWTNNNHLAAIWRVTEGVAVECWLNESLGSYKRTHAITWIPCSFAHRGVCVHHCSFRSSSFLLNRSELRIGLEWGQWFKTKLKNMLLWDLFEIQWLQFWVSNHSLNSCESTKQNSTQHYGCKHTAYFDSSDQYVAVLTNQRYISIWFKLARVIILLK